MPDPTAGEDALPRRARPPHRRSERDYRISVGPRFARPTRRGGGTRGWSVAWHGSQGAPGRRLLRTGPPPPLFGADAHPAAIPEGDHHDQGPRRRRSHHAAIERYGL